MWHSSEGNFTENIQHTNHKIMIKIISNLSDANGLKNVMGKN